MPCRTTALLVAVCLAATAATALVPPLQPAWELTAEQGFYSPPTVVGDVVYATDVNGEVRAVSLSDGQPRWSFKAGGSVYSGLAVAGNTGYCGSVDKHVYALDLATGQPRWSRELDAVIYATPVVSGNTVLVGTGESPTFYALDAATGEPRWTFTMGERMGSGLAVDGGTVYVPSYDHRLYALNIAKGQPVWTFEADTILDSQPLVVDGKVYLKLTNDAIIALDQRTGQVAWRTTPRMVEAPSEPTTWSPLRRIGNLLIVALNDGRLQALSVDGGSQVWLSEPGDPFSSPPALAGELAVAGTKEGALAVLDPRVGQTLWRWQPAKLDAPEMISGIMWPPVVAGERLLAASMDGHLYAFQGGDGSWQRPAAKAALNPRGPGRIAVGGLFPMGYAGVLARYGLPRDVLYDAQFGDVETLRRYDLVILAGSLPDEAASKAIGQYLDSGGAAIIDFSGTKIDVPDMPNRNELAMWNNDKSTAPGGFGTRGLSISAPGTPIGPGRLAGIPLADGLVAEKVLGYVPDPKGLQNVTSLVRYPATVQPGKPTGGPAADAVLIGRRGRGTVILCGLQAGVKTEHSGLDLQQLMLAMVKLATAGRATPQLRPDTQHVGYGATVGEVSSDDAMADDVDDVAAASGPQGKLPKDAVLVEAEPAGEYDLTMQVPAKGGVVWLRYWSADQHIRVEVRSREILAILRRGGKDVLLRQLPGNYPAGQPLVIRDRADRLAIETGEVYAEADLTGVPSGAIGQRGFGQSIAYEPTESVYFTDDFMRTDANEGPWELTGGTWSTTSEQKAETATNPFCYKCDAAGETATALAGQEDWNHYRFTCAVQPDSGAGPGTVGVGWFANSTKDMYLFSAAIRQGFAARPKGLQLLKLVDGKATVLAERDGGLSVGQWYNVSVRAAGPTISVELDGVPILSANDSTYRSGKLALRVDHAKARFDDVEATAAVVPRPVGATVEGRAPEHAGLIDVDSWASPATGWEPKPDADGVFWRREVFYGETHLDYEWPSLPDGTTVTLAVSDQRDLARAVTMSLRRHGQQATLSVVRQGQVLQTTELPFGQSVRLGVQREGQQLACLVNGERRAVAELPFRDDGVRLGFAAAGFLPRIAALTVWSAGLQDTTFDTAPTDWWVGSGTWDLTNRWSCVPEWSWYGGYSNDRAAIWSKREFVGDLVVDYYAGAKMMDKNVPGYTGPSQERTGDFNVTLCGDGRDLDQGYSFVIGPQGKGQPYSGRGRISGATATLRRNGEVVAENQQFRLFSQGHNRWSWIRAEIHGDVVTLSADGQRILEYRDPQPLKRGHTAIWTQQNGMLLPRITIAYEGLGDDLLSLR